MKLINTSKTILSKSKFFGYLFEIDNLNEIEKIIEKIKQEHKKFSHICYALFSDSEKIFKNDGEVGQPGKILLSLLERNKLNRHCLIVLRIFGGIKLGPAGVGKAFRKSGENCITGERQGNF